MVISRATVVALARRSEFSTASGYADAAAAWSSLKKPQLEGVRVIPKPAECRT
jgi:hypothetical protein